MALSLPNSAISLALISSLAAFGQTANQIEPNAGTWKTWIISSGKDYRVPPPPGDAATKEELDWLRGFAAEFHPWNRRAKTVLEKLRVTGLVVLVTSIASLALTGGLALSIGAGWMSATELVPTADQMLHGPTMLLGTVVVGALLTAMAALSFSAVVKITTENFMATHAFTPVATLLAQIAASAIGLIPGYALEPGLDEPPVDRRDPLRVTPLPSRPQHGGAGCAEAGKLGDGRGDVVVGDVAQHAADHDHVGRHGTDVGGGRRRVALDHIDAIQLGGGGIERAAVAAGLRTLRNDRVGTRGDRRAGFGERRHAGEPGDAAGLDIGDKFVRKQPHDR